MKRIRLAGLLFCFVVCFLSASFMPLWAKGGRPSSQPPINTAGVYFGYKAMPRVIAIADILKINKTTYSVREFLEVYNPDFSAPLVITEIGADTRLGARPFDTGENWFKLERPVIIEPGQRLRVAEQKRVVSGRLGYDWFRRHIRFNINTNKGAFYSNFIAAPCKK